MRPLPVELHSMQEQVLYGLWKKSNDRTVSQDIAGLSRRYHALTASRPESVLPYFVLSRGYDEKSKNFELFAGSVTPGEELTALSLPAGEYALLTVRPKLGFLWGPAVGEAKRYFYTQWLPASGYQALNLEYEFHTEKALEKHPTIQLIFSVQKQDTEAKK